MLAPACLVHAQGVLRIQLALGVLQLAPPVVTDTLQLSDSAGKMGGKQGWQGGRGGRGHTL